MLDQMGTQKSPEQHPIRQRSPLALAAACGLTGLVLLVSSAWQWADNPQPLFVAWVVFGLAVVWALFARPSVLLDGAGVTFCNVFRDVHIPWSTVTDVEIRWNLRVFVGDRAYTSWAISSQVERPKGASGGMFTMLSGRLGSFASAEASSSTPPPKVTASMVAGSIERARDDYAEAVAGGELVAAPDGEVSITWVPLSLAVVLVPAVAVVALSL